jgi:signal peptidase I
VLLLRAVAAEPYGVPTGSMAPALVGNHKAVACPRCGYPVRVGLAPGADPPAPGPGLPFCPNCDCIDLEVDRAPVSRGDQLLVNKTVFDWRRPRRWEMIVFRCPADPARAFVKRVVGLPGETVGIRGGDVYIDHELARKTLAQVKALRLPVFDHNFQPADGWQTRWRAAPDGAPAYVEGAALRLDAAAEADAYQWLIYRNWLLEEARPRPLRDEYSYNGGDATHASRAVHDFMLSCDVEVVRGAGWLALGLTDGGDEMLAELPVGAGKGGTRLRDRERVYRTAPDFALSAGRTYHVELAFVDRRLTLAVDGSCPLAPVDRPAAERRAEVAEPARLGARGVEVRITNFRLFRDIHYTGAGKHGTRAPVELGAGQYFVLGDNSANSDDSRFWSDRDGRPLPVDEASLVGKPFLVHMPGRVVRWQAFGGQWQHQGLDWDRIRWLR